ncbi:complex I NDUFA9 subunit family protein [Roseovarius sp. LXJ103]|uniref:complex I NDUFA9 subunit family protein n=1 Tax=Roseovarius carneus TaxID=2853164 RepID=UPI000D605BB2|nr:complex I NDUFA9 subunit family protein [Roseovarius carneus]MBZ8118330.1 complex I NDUFA9 subunit family protein [Roseovarius carneus]PWE35955.1 complex I NDUFA9 subunit family protein [Pelagicola sp. LXJ1103]
MSKLVTIYGGSGFVGRYIARRLAQAGWRIRVAVRRPNEAMFVKPYGSVGQVEPVLCNIRDDASVRAVMQGADVVINCVGTFDRKGKNNFTAVQDEGAARIARIAADEGVARMVHLSAIGADADGASLYAQSKGRGEAAIFKHFPTAVILRPSVVFGAEDQFFNRFAGMTRLGPVLPVVGADTKFQPVYVDDLAKAAVMGAEGTAKPGIYELGGPDVDTFAGLMRRMLKVIRRRRLVVNIPYFVATPLAIMMELAQTLSFGIIPAQITRDQVRSLKSDNVVPEGARGFADLEIAPQAMGAVLPDYLWRFRPSGQYSAIKESANDLRD